MVKVKEKENTEQLVPLDQTDAVKAVDAKLVPLQQQLAALEAKVWRWRGLLNPGVDVNRTERSILEAQISLPQGEIERSRLALEIGDLEKEKARVRAVEKERITNGLRRQLLEAAEDFLAAMEGPEALHQKMQDIQESFPSFGCEAVADSYLSDDLMRIERTRLPWIHSLRERVRQERVRLNGR